MTSTYKVQLQSSYWELASLTKFIHFFMLATFTE